MEGVASVSTDFNAVHPATAAAESNVSSNLDQGTLETTRRVEEDEADGCHGCALRDNRKGHQDCGKTGAARARARILYELAMLRVTRIGTMNR